MADEAAEATHHPGEELLRVAEAVHAGEVSVTFEPGPTVLAKVGDKLLDIAEASQVPIESGCRMGMCGSDPVRVEYGAQSEHYPVVGEVLIGTMAEVAGDRWKPEYTAAWQEAYGVVQQVMLSGASRSH